MIKDIYDLIRDLIEEADKHKLAEIKMLAADISVKLSDLKKESVELYEENLTLKRMLQEKETIEEMERRIVRGKNTVADYTTEKGEMIKICTACWDNNSKIVQLQEYETGAYWCPVCKAYRMI